MEGVQEGIRSLMRECSTSVTCPSPVVQTGVMAAGAPAEPACPNVKHGGFKKLSSQSGVIYTLTRLGHLG